MRLLLFLVVMVIANLCTRVTGEDAEGVVDEGSLYSDKESSTKNDAEESSDEQSQYNEEEGLMINEENDPDTKPGVDETAADDEDEALMEPNENQPEADPKPWGRRRRRWIRRRRRRWMRRRFRIRIRIPKPRIRVPRIRIPRIRIPRIRIPRIRIPSIICRRRRRRYRGGRNVGGGRIRSHCLKTATLLANIARGKPASQSSQCCGGTPRRAVDGNDNPNWHGGSCTHTHYQANSWWMVDLKASYWIGQVVVTNRGDCCGNRLNGAEIRVGNSQNSGGSSNALCKGGLNVPRGQSRTFLCTRSLQGRYVTIRKTGTAYLTLCEVQVFPLAGNNVARGKPTRQVSECCGGKSNKAVDGNINSIYNGGSCTETHNYNHPWWMVDLQAVYPIGKIVITNRGDCCGDRLNPFEIRVGNSGRNGGTSNPVCNSGLKILQGQTRAFNCKSYRSGRYVTIRVNKHGPLTLCEVQVFPEDLDSALAKCWAPKLYLKSNEKYFPSSVDFFLRHVSLYDNGRHKKQTHLTSMNLVQMGASNWYLSSNAHLGSATSRLPFFSGEDPRTHSVPTYCLVRHHGLYTDFVYWFFRPYNYGKKVCIGYVTCVGCVGYHKEFGNHVGDWEHVTVRLSNYLPHKMYIGAHNFGGEYDWNGQTFKKGSEPVKISRDGHPVIFAAEGSHGNWVGNKRYVYKKLKTKDTLVDYTDTGIEWRTWENLQAIPFKKNGGYTGIDSWLNFKGRWGNRKMGCGISDFKIYEKIANECQLNSGPTAPNWKGVMQKLKLDKKK